MAPFVLILFFTIALLVSVMFSGAQIALGTVSRESIEKLIENKVRGASLIYSISHNRRRFQLLFLSGRIIAIVSGSFILTTFIHRNILEWSPKGILAWAVAFIVAVIAFILSEGVFARLVSMGENEDTVPRFAYFLGVFHILLFPVTCLMDMALSLVIEKQQELAAKEDALIELVKSESESGVLEQEERDMIEGVLDFFDTTVREVMVPRIDMIAVEKDIEVDELIALFKNEGHSRIPVFDERIDSIIGVIYAKDILPIIAQNGKENLSIAETMRKPYFVHESKKISVLLREFKQAKVHIAVVVDEYGGTAGIVALEDLLEEIVGEIQDEYDREVRDYLWINETTVLMDAGLDIDDVNEIIHADIPTGDFDTLAGFIYHQLGLIPEGGEEFHWENLTFTIKQIQGNRISKVLVKLDEPLITSRDEPSQ